MTHAPKSTHGGPRPNSGRPALPDKVTVTIYAPAREKAGWVCKAKQAGVSLSEWIRQRCRG